MEDQRRRTLEALERRFVQAKEEFQNQKGKKRSADDRIQEFSSEDNTIKKSVISSRRGIVSFSGRTSKQDVEVNEPTYFELFHHVDEKLLQPHTEICDAKVKVDSILHELIQHGDSAQKYIHGSKSIKIENNILLDNYVHKSGMSTHSCVPPGQHFSKRSKKRMSLSQHKKRGTFNFPEEFHNFEFFKPMHEKWKSYILKLLKIVGKDDQLAQCFFNADLHGATMLVVQCKVVSYVGVHGIMIRETRKTFGIITHDNKFKVVLKKGSVFLVQADSWKVTLLGDRFASRSVPPKS